MAKEEPIRAEDVNAEDPKLNDLFQGLEEVIEAMERADVSLEESFQLYHRGIDLLKSCNDKIDKIEKKMLVLDDEGEVYRFE